LIIAYRRNTTIEKSTYISKESKNKFQNITAKSCILAYTINELILQARKPIINTKYCIKSEQSSSNYAQNKNIKKYYKPIVYQHNINNQ
jgi:hypothetical protein